MPSDSYSKLENSPEATCCFLTKPHSACVARAAKRSYHQTGISLPQLSLEGCMPGLASTTGGPPALLIQPVLRKMLLASCSLYAEYNFQHASASTCAGICGFGWTRTIVNRRFLGQEDAPSPQRTDSAVKLSRNKRKRSCFRRFKYVLSHFIIYKRFRLTVYVGLGRI